MKLEWMGEYRDVVEKLMKYCNQYGNIYKREMYHGTKIKISYAQVQVIEYLLENEDRHQNMSMIASRLGISLSVFSKLANQLVKKGLLQKFHTKTNKKDVIIQVTELGRSTYADYCDYIVRTHFRLMFEVADQLPRDTLPIIANMLDVGLKPVIPDDESDDLIPIPHP